MLRNLPWHSVPLNVAEALFAWLESWSKMALKDLGYGGE